MLLREGVEIDLPSYPSREGGCGSAGVAISSEQLSGCKTWPRIEGRVAIVVGRSARRGIANSVGDCRLRFSRGQTINTSEAKGAVPPNHVEKDDFRETIEDTRTISLETADRPSQLYCKSWPGPRQPETWVATIFRYTRGRWLRLWLLLLMPLASLPLSCHDGQE